MGLSINSSDGQTPLEEDEKDGLKIHSITTQGELNDFEQLNIEKAVAWSIRARLRQDQILSEKFIKQLHLKMYGDVWKWAGTFRKSEKNIGVSWHQIGIALKGLLDDTKYWIEHNSYSAEETAIRFKHRLVAIHCFPNGNGRHSRLMADIIMESIYKKEPFTWHAFSSRSVEEIRKDYISALKKADNGNINPLIGFATG